MTNMTRQAGRPSRYSSEEDAIILGTANASSEETNRQLVEHGFSERSPNAIKQRRWYLQHHAVRDADAPSSILGGEMELTQALTKRRQLQTELARAEQAAEKIRAELAVLNATVNELLDRLKGELEEGDGSE